MPGWLPAVVFGLLTLALFREFVVSGGMLFGTDVMALGYFAREFYADVVRGMGTFPLWNPRIFGGLPFVDAMHGDIFYPTTVLQFVLPVHRGMGWKLVLHVFLAGLFTYAWLRHLGVARLIALFGGATYLLAPVMVSLVYPGHDGKLFVTALTPLLLWVTDRAMAGGRPWQFGLVALVVALLIFTPHVQLAYYATWAVGALGVFRAVRAYRSSGRARRPLVRIGGLLAAGIVGAMLIGAIQLWTPLRYITSYSQRAGKTIEAEAESAYERATSWSLHAEEAASLVVPEFVGGPAGGQPVGTYWGRNAFKLNHEYSGLIPLLLVPFAFLVRRRRPEVWLFSGMAGVSLIFALGATTPLFRLFYWLIPGVELFRAPSSIMFLFAIGVITAAALGLQGAEDRLAGGAADSGRGKQGREEEAAAFARRGRIYLWGAAGFLGFLALLGSAGMLTDLWTSLLYRDMPAARAAALEASLPGLRTGLWIATLLAVALAGGWHLRSTGKLGRVAWIGAVIALSVLDLWRVDQSFIRVIEPQRHFSRDDTVDWLVQRTREEPPFRAFLLGGDAYTPNHLAIHGIDQLVGHHGNEIGRYRELVEERLTERTLELLNARYLVSSQPLNAPGLREAYRGSRSLVYEVEGALPRAFLVTEYEVAPDSVAVDRLLSRDFDPRRTALLSRDPDVELQGPPGTVEWLGYEPNRMSLRVRSPGRALLIIGDNYYPEWRASIDGEPTEVLRADYTLRAVVVPAGEHEVRLDYRSPLLRASAAVSVATLLGVLALVAVSLRADRRGRRAEPAPVPAEVS